MASDPGLLHRLIALPEWVDGNRRMNLACHVLVFDGATDLVCDVVGFGEEHRCHTGTGVFAVETHIPYRAELLQGDQIEVWPYVAGADDKRLHLAHEMLRDRRTVACRKVMLLHVSLDTRRVTPFPPGIAEEIAALARNHARLPRPDWLERQASMPSLRPPA